MKLFINPLYSSKSSLHCSAWTDMDVNWNLTVEWSCIQCWGVNSRKVALLHFVSKANIIPAVFNISIIVLFFVFLIFLWPFGFIDRIAEDMTGKRLRKRERGSDKQQRAPGRDSKTGPLQQGQSLCTWNACSTHSSKQRPTSMFKVRAIFWTFELFHQLPDWMAYYEGAIESSRFIYTFKNYKYSARALQRNLI